MVFPAHAGIISDAACLTNVKTLAYNIVMSKAKRVCLQQLGLRKQLKSLCFFFYGDSQYPRLYFCAGFFPHTRVLAPLNDSGKAPAPFSEVKRFSRAHG